MAGLVAGGQADLNLDRVRRSVGFAAVLITVVVVALLYLGLQRERGVTRAGSRTIAVLPFRLLSEGAADEYLGLGLADALITRLGNLRQVVVRPTSMVRKYNGANTDPVEAGESLKVEAVLEGKHPAS